MYKLNPSVHIVWMYLSGRLFSTHMQGEWWQKEMLFTGWTVAQGTAVHVGYNVLHNTFWWSVNKLTETSEKRHCYFNFINRNMLEQQNSMTRVFIKTRIWYLLTARLHTAQFHKYEEYEMLGLIKYLTVVTTILCGLSVYCIRGNTKMCPQTWQLSNDIQQCTNLNDCSSFKWSAELSKSRIFAIPSLPSWLPATKPLYSVTYTCNLPIFNNLYQKLGKSILH